MTTLMDRLGDPPVRPRPYGSAREPFECVCDDPRPDSVGECQNDGCRRGVMADWYARTREYAARLRSWTEPIEAWITLDTDP